MRRAIPSVVYKVEVKSLRKGEVIENIIVTEVKNRDARVDIETGGKFYRVILKVLDEIVMSSVVKLIIKNNLPPILDKAVQD